MAKIAEASVPRPLMLEAIRRIRVGGLRVAALTNNWVAKTQGRGDNTPRARLDAHFDLFVESAVVGLRKPDPRIYALVCEKLGVAPPRVAFLDDIGRNLKTARALGMATIKVDEPEQALRELGTLLGLDLVSDRRFGLARGQKRRRTPPRTVNGSPIEIPRRLSARSSRPGRRCSRRRRRARRSW